MTAVMTGSPINQILIAKLKTALVWLRADNILYPAFAMSSLRALFRQGSQMGQVDFTRLDWIFVRRNWFKFTNC